MNSFIPKQPRHERERVEAKLDARLVRRLEKYCQYLESDRDYVVAQALEVIFRKDRGFAQWLEAQGGLQPLERSTAKRPRAARAATEPPLAAETGIVADQGRGTA